MTIQNKKNTPDTKEDGIEHHACTSWPDLANYLLHEIDHTKYIWRGQSNSDWRLYSSFDRLVKEEIRLGNKHFTMTAARAYSHLQKFKYAARGKHSLESLLSSDNPDSENEWWALGQHSGLKTPLLDWTHSPFVALYFAIRNHLKNDNLKFALWGLADLRDIYDKEHSPLNKDSPVAVVSAITNDLTSIQSAKDTGFSDTRPLYKNSLKQLDPTKKFYSRQTTNKRLISQSALFTRTCFGMSMDEWVAEKVQKHKLTSKILIKITIKMDNNSITKILNSLNSMNINEMTLFPDLHGVAGFCNTALAVAYYYEP